MDRTLERSTVFNVPDQDDQIAGDQLKISRNDAVLHYWKVTVIAFQLGLLLFALFSFQIEKEQGFPSLLPLIFFGFVLYSLLPIRFRLPFFFILTNIGFVVILGLKHAAIVTLISMALFLVSHIPIHIAIRGLLLLAAGVVLAAIRMGQIETTWGHKVLPIVCSMFMFRLLLYFDDLASKKPVDASWWQRLCYFFLLPNVCFLVFPVVDYRTFVASYKSKGQFPTMQKGINWMLWGTLQLLLYRIVYDYWIPSPAEVVDARSLMLYLFTGYMFLLRIAGQVYLAIGILCLFGFDLPPMFRNYFLSTGFSDFWRRTYLYWKTFITKVFYYRIFSMFRNLRVETSIGITVLSTFVLTWLLHSYQFFWLKGIFPLQGVDGLFWGLFGLLVALNSVMEMKKKKRKMLGDPKWSYSDALKRSVYWIFFFTFMCILWSLWGSGSIREWLDTMKVAGNVRVREILPAAMIVGIAVMLGTFFQWFHWNFQKPFLARSTTWQAVVAILILSVMLGIKNQSSHSSKDSRFAAFILSIQEPRLNERDRDTQVRGYYEPLMTKEKYLAQFAESPIADSERTDKKGKTIKTQTGNVVQLNRWGMRDKEYKLKKPEGTYRIVVLGGSIERGMGVEGHEVFESIVEERLNQLPGKKRTYEILNFAVGTHDIIQYVRVLESRALRFNPDAVFCFAHSEDEIMVIKNAAKNMGSPTVKEHAALRKIYEKSGLTTDVEYYDMARRMRPYVHEVLEWGTARIGMVCRQRGVIPVWLALPTPAGITKVIDRRMTAETHGFITIDLLDAYGDEDPVSLQLSRADDHLNAKGHQLVADHLFQKILENQHKLGLQF